MNLFKYFLVTICTGIFTICYSQTYIQEGSVSGLWEASNSPYYVEGNIIINEGDLLEIEPGVQVYFTDSFYIYVEGSLEAIGTEQDSIYFDIADTTGFHENQLNSVTGGWKGILINQSNQSIGTALFEYCDIRHVKNYGNLYINQQIEPQNLNDFLSCAIGCYYSDTISIKHSNIGYNKSTSLDTIINGEVPSKIRAGLGFKECESKININSNKIHHHLDMSGIIINESVWISNSGDISQNQIYNNIGYAAGGIYAGGNVKIEHNEIHHNQVKGRLNVAGEGTGGGIAGIGQLFIIGNDIRYNSALQGGGGISIRGTEETGSPKIISNFIANNVVTNGTCGAYNGGGGIRLYYCKYDTALVQNNIVVNNTCVTSWGGGIMSGTSRIYFYNNLIANNLAYRTGGIQLSSDSNSVIVNSIIHSNISEDNVFDQYYCSNFFPLPQIINCHVSDLFNTYGLDLDTMNVNNVSPNFVNPSLGVGYTYSTDNTDWHSQQVEYIDGGTNNPNWLYFYLGDFDDYARFQGNQIDIGPYEDGNALLSLEENSDIKVSIWPNPSNGIFNFIMTSNNLYTLRVFDNSGKQVLLRENVSGRIELNLPEGIYHYTLSDDIRQFKSGKIIRM